MTQGGSTEPMSTAGAPPPAADARGDIGASVRALAEAVAAGDGDRAAGLVADLEAPDLADRI